MKINQPLAMGLFAIGLIGCAKTSEAPKATYKKLPAGEQYSGFLKDYSAMKSNAALGGEAVSYVNPDKMKSLHRYIAIIVDPVDVFVATDADNSLIPPKAGEAISNYYRRALVHAIGDAFPIVEQPGPLVLRLRSAISGIDLGGEVAPLEKSGESMKRAIVLEKVGVEMELVDSESGERIAALVDKENLGSGAQVGSASFSREERFVEAKRAFDGWAQRVREFLDTEHELSPEDADKAKKAYHAYGQ